MLLSVEDLCPGKQLVRFRSWPSLGRWGLGLFGVLGLLALGAAGDRAWIVGSVLGVAACALLLRTLREAAYSQSTLLQMLRASEPSDGDNRDGFSGELAQTDAE